MSIINDLKPSPHINNITYPFVCRCDMDNPIKELIKITIYRVPQFMSKNINVICVNGEPICTVRGAKNTNNILAKLNGCDIIINDGRINKIIENYMRKKLNE